MEGGEGEEGLRLSKRFESGANKSGEVDYKTKAGTAWSHSFLNQKPWHPLSYPNQRRKWIAEQTDAQSNRRAEEIAREYSQEQEFFRQTALVSKEQKEKMEIMKAVSFMYVRPPGYNAESAKAAEVADESKMQEENDPTQNPTTMSLESMPIREKKKPRPKDVFGRPLPTEEEFEVLKNAPRLDTGVAGRSKPFGIEVRNVKCVRCGNYGHQSGDRECLLKDAIMPNEESRLKRDDPLTAILAQTDPSEPLKWELKQKPGISPPRGGFRPDDPNQQIVAEDIFDEYGGFLNGNNVPELLASFSANPEKKFKKKSKLKKELLSFGSGASEDDFSLSKDGDKRLKKKKHKKKKKRNHSESSSSDILVSGRHNEKSSHKYPYSSDDSDAHKHHLKKDGHKHSYSYEDYDYDRHCRSLNHYRYHRGGGSRHKCSFSSEESYSDGQPRSRKGKPKHSHPYQDSDVGSHYKSAKSRHKSHHSHQPIDSDSEWRDTSRHRNRHHR